MRRSFSLALLLAGSAPVALHAQTAPAPPPHPAPAPTPTPAAAPQSDDDGSDEGDIVVTGSRALPGAVVGDIPPEQSLGPADVRSYGVNSVSDLLNELAPQIRSDRGSGGAPVVLLNGRRISSFAEIRDLPTEAIARVDILPEEVALKYGYSADQKVVNIVLRPRFKAITSELGDQVATEGGRNTPSGTLDVVTIRRDNRLSLHVGYSQSSPLYENERDILPLASTPTPPGTVDLNHDFDQRPYRTLLSSSRNLQTNLVYAHPLGRVNATINGSFQYTDSTGAQGLPTFDLTLPASNPFSTAPGTTEIDRVATGFDPLRQRNSALTYHLGTGFNGQFGTQWRWSLTANYDRIDSENFGETGFIVHDLNARLAAGDPSFNPFGPIDPLDYPIAPANRGQSTSNSGTVDALVNGKLIKLPAGEISTAIRVGGSLSSLDSQSYRFDTQSALATSTAGSTRRNEASGQINIDVPIASSSKKVLAFLGDLSINGNLAVHQLSDFGTLTTRGYGANWQPIHGVRLITSVTDQDDAPSAAQLANPVVVTPNVRVFDYVKGETVNVTSTTGGNPFLRADSKHTFKLGLTLKPWDKTDFTLTANYIESHVRNAIAGFPAATAAVEAAFPGRFTRDADGDLTSIDTRSVNFARTDRSELRWGFNISKPIKSKLQKEVEAFRAGTGPNPFQGLRLPGGRRFGERPQGGGGQSQGNGANPNTTGTPPQDGSNPNATGTPPPQNGATGGERPGGGRFGGGGFGGGGRGFRGGGGGRGAFGGGGGRLQFAFYHTWHFTDRVEISPTLPTIDLLNGGAIGSGGQSRHEFEMQAGYSNNGIGVRLSGDWQSGTRVLGGTPGTPNTLDFSSLGTLNVRLFADLSQQLKFIKKNPWATGMRVTLGVSNLLDSRQRVRDANGQTPISYQPDYLDPMGRTIKLSIRKVFF
ncbi:MAG: TonB-dependent receptor [Sphingomonas sp.]|uniref:TonB-dependent receptor n=1 Tax=Sphingomonas sp. TaxID=28214 RepID=UPI003F812743